MAIDFGYDASGRGNNWTANNLSSTAGAGNDSLTDTPTSYGTDTGVGGTVRGNYCTMNPLDYKGSAIAASNGNLNLAWTSSNASMASTIGVSSGKWYWEVTIGSFTDRAPDVGIYNRNLTAPIADCVGASAYGYSYYGFDGQKFNNNARSSYGATYTTNDVIGVALDLDAGTLVFYKNGVSQGTAFSSLPSSVWVAASGNGSPSTAAVTYNFGQRAFAYTAPSGFKALCTQNLPTPTIGATSTTQANDYFDALLWTGNGTTQNITTANFQPDWLWVKERSEARSNLVWDAVRGSNLGLLTNSTNAESSQPSFTGFLSNGFGVSNTDASDITNKNAQTYVGWIWKANGAGSSNTAGTITSTVSASTTAGFSIATYTGNGSAGATVGHGLGVTPSMIFVKSRSVGTAGWVVWHTSLTLGANSYLVLEGTQAQQTTNQPWNNTLPTSSVFSLRTWDAVNQNGSTYVAYLFAAVAGYSAFGSYTGNGSADGPFVYLGFRPAYVLLKASSTTSSWRAYDYKRLGYNLNDDPLFPNATSTEASEAGGIDLVSNGFKIRWSDTVINGSGSTYIYAAFAEFPFKYSLAE